MKTRKYTYYKVIQQNWGWGWEDVDFHETDSNYNSLNTAEFMGNLKAYKTEQSAPVRVVKRKELNFTK